MFSGFKQQLDRWAIRLATKSLSPGKGDPSECDEVERLMREASFFEPAGKAAEVQFGSGQTFRFPSRVKTSSPRNDLAHGRFFPVDEGWRARPLIVLVHGWNAELHYLYVLPLVARALNKRGFNAALMELPYHLQRRPSRAERMHDFISDDLPGMLRATRQSVADLDSLFLWAKEQGCQKLALWGFSLGAWLAGLYICHSSTCDAAVLTTPLLNLERAIVELEFCHPVRAALEAAPVSLNRLNLAEYRPRIPTRNILLTEGELDLFIPRETYRELAAAWGMAEWHTVPQSHISVMLSRRAMLETIDWLRQRLL